MRFYTEEEVRAILRARVQEAPSVRAWAEQFGPSVRANVYRAISGKIKVGGDLAKAAGLRRIVLEAYVEEDAEISLPEGWTDISGSATRVGTGRPSGNNRKHEA